eukprot:TRINITY_DN5969_c0_g1_i1.p1 TRINITY_DN5969_c0_g1~~TRINITY_DN5969_c0_g1_i1.p1  ORF type:complete len:327 (-),score=67.03 TRINITY_DN5969_c0_g1_i1:466-1446(-)
MAAEVIVNPHRLLRLCEMLPLLTKVLSPQRFQQQTREKSDGADGPDIDVWKYHGDEMNNEELLRPLLQQSYLFPAQHEKLVKFLESAEQQERNGDEKAGVERVMELARNYKQYYDIYGESQLASRVEAAAKLKDVPESYLLLAEESATSLADAVVYLEDGDQLATKTIADIEQDVNENPWLRPFYEVLKFSSLIIKQRLGYAHSKLGHFAPADLHLMHVYNTDKEDRLLARMNLVYLYFTCDKGAELRMLLRQTANHLPTADYLYSVSLCAFQQDNDMVKAMEFFDLIGRAVRSFTMSHFCHENFDVANENRGRISLTHVMDLGRF